MIPGERVIKQGVYVYVCPTCGNEARFDDEYGPACTGPRSTDDHEMAAMQLSRVDDARPAVLIKGFK